ncbi:MAG TPA: TetR/AcrR family transcriptional regulator [Ktedonobacteraceae bacterium]|nr:TetR/AcrR family transcriptional regulator [Ktedonobacteraceae bacterium]
MPRTEEANQRLREAQRTKILEAARQVFARKGWSATMADVAEAADVSQGLAYRYFKNKQEIFRALVQKAMEAGPAGTQRFLEMPGSPGERLSLLLSVIVRSRHEHPEFALLFDHVLSDETISDDFRELILKQSQSFLVVLRQLIVEGQATGEIADDDPDQLMLAIIASLDGLTRLVLHRPEQFKQHFPDARIILRMLKPDQK